MTYDELLKEYGVHVFDDIGGADGIACSKSTGEFYSLSSIIEMRGRLQMRIYNIGARLAQPKGFPRFGQIEESVIDFLTDCGAQGALATGARIETLENYIMSKQSIPKAVSEYMAKIGSTGGSKGKGTAERKARAAKAAKARWDKERRKKKKAS